MSTVKKKALASLQGPFFMSTKVKYNELKNKRINSKEKFVYFDRRCTQLPSLALNQVQRIRGLNGLVVWCFEGYVIIFQKSQKGPCSIRSILEIRCTK
ncbi:hypothetical protein BGP_0926 [Beggiatoa sp. PS]|nr:hypothetical protein BGP_0926 [Beggiatoa sp. PS]